MHEEAKYSTMNVSFGLIWTIDDISLAMVFSLPLEI